MTARGGKVALMITGIARPVGARAGFGAMDDPGGRVQTAVLPAVA